MNKEEKFDAFKKKMAKLMDDQDAVSESGNSEQAEEEIDGNKEAEEELKDEMFLKKSTKLQKDGLVSIAKIIQKE